MLLMDHAIIRNLPTVLLIEGVKKLQLDASSAFSNTTDPIKDSSNENEVTVSKEQILALKKSCQEGNQSICVRYYHPNIVYGRGETCAMYLTFAPQRRLTFALQKMVKQIWDCEAATFFYFGGQLF